MTTGPVYKTVHDANNCPGSTDRQQACRLGQTATLHCNLYYVQQSGQCSNGFKGTTCGDGSAGCPFTWRQTSGPSGPACPIVQDTSVKNPDNTTLIDVPLSDQPLVPNSSDPYYSVRTGYTCFGWD
jgi:hypothetical protein